MHVDRPDISCDAYAGGMNCAKLIDLLLHQFIIINKL